MYFMVKKPLVTFDGKVVVVVKNSGQRGSSDWLTNGIPYFFFVTQTDGNPRPSPPSNSPL